MLGALADQAGRWTWDSSSGMDYLHGDVNDAALFEALKKLLEEHRRSRTGRKAIASGTWRLLPEFFDDDRRRHRRSTACSTPEAGTGWSSRNLSATIWIGPRANASCRAMYSRGPDLPDRPLPRQGDGPEPLCLPVRQRDLRADLEPALRRSRSDHGRPRTRRRDRGSFYEQAGALRDVGQNHLLQLLALIAMEPPVAWDARSDPRREGPSAEGGPTLAGLRLRTIFVVRGQYEGYRDEKDVDPHSSTESFVAMKLLIDNWRWADVPFYLRTGKKLPRKVTRIAIQFKDVPHLLFKKTAVEELEPNVLVIRIQPDEGFTLTFGAKVPGQRSASRPSTWSSTTRPTSAPARPRPTSACLLDCMLGDATLFTRVTRS